MADNVFNADGQYLVRVRDDLAAREELTSRVSGLKSDLKRREKSIAAEEKSINDEISSTVKKRRNGVESQYDRQISDIRSKRKKVESEKSKKISEAKSSRLQEETKHIVSDSKEAEKELRKLFRKNNVPAFCSSKLFYVMFMPDGMTQIFMMVVGYLVAIVGIPWFFTWLIRKTAINSSTMSDGGKTAVTVVIALLFIAIVGFAIFMLYKKVKVPHAETLRQGARYRKAVADNDKQIRDRKRSINKDEDISRYDLGDVDERIQQAIEEEEVVQEEKSRALQEFDDSTADNIRMEIEERRLPGLNEMKQDRDARAAELAQSEADLNEKNRIISNEHAAHLGEDMMRRDKIEALIQIMESGQAATVSAALQLYKNPPPVNNSSAPRGQ